MLSYKYKAKNAPFWKYCKGGPLITNPIPITHSFQLARPRLKRPADYLILERLKKENRRDLCVAHVKYIDTNDLRVRHCQGQIGQGVHTLLLSLEHVS